MKKSVVITGGNRGIGAATAMLAARNGWDVCISYNRHGAQADDIVCRIGEAGGKAIAVQADMACEDAIVAMFARCDAELSPLGGLVNNAGFLGGESYIEDFDANGIGPRAHYATTNGARRTFTFALAKQVGPLGIRVNGVMPGVIDTNFNDDFDNQGRNERLKALVPLGRVGTGPDVGETIVWLLSDSAAYVSGAVVPVTGGMF